MAANCASTYNDISWRVLRAAGEYHQAVDNFRRSAALNQLHMYRRTVAAIERARALAAGTPQHVPQGEGDLGEAPGARPEMVKEWGRLESSLEPSSDQDMDKLRVTPPPFGVSLLAFDAPSLI